MHAAAARRLVSLLICAPIVSAFGAACGGEPAPETADCIKVVQESGQTTDECLPVSPDNERVDLATPMFTNPTPIINPLHPTSLVQQTIYGGQADSKPFRTEVTLLPGTLPISWHGQTVETAIVQYVAYLDGRIHEVAIDRYAQADDGSVWYFGEDVFNYEDGKVADTNGTWVANDQTPPAMIMPAEPRPGNVYRPEDAPGIVFEEVRVDKVGQEVTGPSGKISGAIEVNELHMDGTREAKVFAPGYGEFSTGDPGGDLEAVSLSVPTDARPGPVPAEFGALSTAVSAVYDAALAEDAERLKQADQELGQAWDTLRSKRIPPQMESQMEIDVAALKRASSEEDWVSARSAALRITENELDLRLLHLPVIDVDLARLQMWTRQLPVDIAADDTDLALADVAALERVWERTLRGVEPTAPVAASLQELRKEADAENLAGMERSVTPLKDAVAGLHTS